MSLCRRLRASSHAAARLATMGAALLGLAAAAGAEAPASTAASAVVRTEHAYQEPDAILLNMDGRNVPVRPLLEVDQPMMLDFIYTSCTAICPMLSETFAQVQRELGADAAGVRMVSISIDPEYDTPRVLRDYAQAYHPGPQWLFLTGRSGEVVDLQRAFDAYRANKMDHAQVIFLRAGRGRPWIRYEGPVSPATLVRELRAMRPAKAPAG
jgi:protein SCO1